MTAPKLPLQLRLGIRDQFDKPECSVQKAFGTIESILGLKVICNVEWDSILHELNIPSPDKSTLVPTVCGAIVAWCDCLQIRLEDDKFATWTDQFVDKLEAVGSVKLHVQVSDTQYSVTTWMDEHSTFVIFLPRRTTFGASAAPNFETGLENAFVATRNIDSSEERADADGAEIDSPSFDDQTSLSGPPIFTPSVTTISRSNTFGAPAVERMPTVSATPSPDTLLRNMMPYILHVTQRNISRMTEQSSGRVYDQGSSKFGQHSTNAQMEQGGNTIVVQGTHEPTLQFLNEYLSRWIKKDHQDTRKCPLLRTTLHESPVGHGLMYDSLSIGPYDIHQERRGVQMNVTVVISIIENVLGYRSLPRVSAGLWEFRRDTPFQ